MNILDLRTVLAGYVISASISAVVMISLYLQNRSRSPELILWPAGFVAQFLGILLITLRGVIPDFYSIVLGNLFLQTQAVFIFFGLGRFLQRPVRLRLNVALLALFLGLAVYFTYAQPSLFFRNLNFSVLALIISLQAAWLTLRQFRDPNASSVRLAGYIFAGYALFSVFRIVSDLVINPGTDFLSSGLPDTLVILTYQMLSISLTFTLFLMVNRRLVADLEDDIQQRAAVEEDLRRSEERFAIAFHTIPDAIVISLADTGEIIEVNDRFYQVSGYTPAETLGKTSFDLQFWIDPADRSKYLDAIKTFGRADHIETTLRKKNHEIMICQMSGEIIKLKQGPCLLTFIREVTESRKIEAAEKEQRALAEALRGTAAAMNSTLKFDEVLDLILDNVGRVMPHDTANFMVLEDDRQLKIVRSRGYTEHGLPDLTGQRYSLDKMPLLKRVADQRMPLAIPDVHSEPDWIPHPTVERVHSYAVAPIRSRGRTTGFLNLESTQKGFFHQALADRLQAFADQASIAIENARLYEDVQELAIKDPLTGLFNRRGLFQLGEREIMRSKRLHHPLAAVMLDIDHFKRVNDTYGHQTGDQVLVTLADCLRANMRTNVDLSVRYGGEEFFLLLPETTQASAWVVAERIRQAVEDLVIVVEAEGNQSARTVQITISLGLVMLTPHTQDLAELLERADQTMYAAKKAGRNRVVVGDAEGSEPTSQA